MMTTRERWLAALRMQPVDRLPFWPKIDSAYMNAHSDIFPDKNTMSAFRWIGCDPHIGIGGPFKELNSTSRLEKNVNGGIADFLYSTPFGNMTAKHTYDPASASWHPVEFPIKSREDILRMTAYYDDMMIEKDDAGIENARAQCEKLGGDACTMQGIGESPLMEFVEWLAGVENAHLLLSDYTDDVERLFASMHRILLMKTELSVNYSPADTLYFIENTSTTLISPAQYREYCLPVLNEYTSIGHNAGRLMVLHMCGHLKALLPDLATLPVAGFEAFTSPTLGNTTLLDGRTACPNTCLIGGTNAMMWAHHTADEIIKQIKNDLDSLPHHRGLVVTSAGVMPPLCAPDTIRKVCQWVQNYPVL
jgi:uroporphyrinogen-III decarboxylase